MTTPASLQGVLLEEIKQADLAKKAEEDAKDPLAQGDDL